MLEVQALRIEAMKARLGEIEGQEHKVGLQTETVYTCVRQDLTDLRLLACLDVYVLILLSWFSG